MMWLLSDGFQYIGLSVQCFYMHVLMCAYVCKYNHRHVFRLEVILAEEVCTLSLDQHFAIHLETQIVELTQCS